jgi:16S rRNA (cytidine1402-2'-O)-methyltransferase
VARLVLVPTPIGNLQDITLRALETLRGADVVAAEDTRHSRKLLTHFAIDKPLLRLDQHTILARAPAVLAEHGLVAFVTDAGTPGVSDPGAELVRLALDGGHAVEVLPGPTALIPALVLSGLPLARFAFEGFLPRKGKERRERLGAIAASPVTVAFYESSKRLLATLDDLILVCGEGRQASISRELSKRYETTLRGTLAELKAQFGGTEPKGEVVMVIAPVSQASELDFAAEAGHLAAEGLRGSQLRRALQDLGAPRNLAYELALSAEVNA